MVPTICIGVKENQISAHHGWTCYVTDLLLVTHNMLKMMEHLLTSWRACQIEGTNWGGIVEENICEYASIGIAD